MPGACRIPPSGLYLSRIAVSSEVDTASRQENASNRKTFGENMKKRRIAGLFAGLMASLGAALFLGTVGLIGGARANDLQKLSMRRWNAIHCRVFPVRFPRPSAARWQGGDAGQAPGAVRFALYGQRGHAEDHKGGSYHAQACQTAGNGMRADMKKGRNDFVPTLFYLADRAQLLDASLPKFGWHQ